jgi:plastocyanin
VSARSRTLAASALTLAACALLTTAVPAALSSSTHGPAHHATANAHRCHRAAHARRGAHRHMRCRAHRRRGAAPHAPGASPTGGTEAPAGPSVEPLAPAPGSPSAPAGELPAAPPSVPHVLITATEWSFSLSRTSVPAGKVVLGLVNHGQDEHNLNATSEGSVAGSLPDTNPGELRQLTLDMHAGSYVLFCSLPEHAARGMKATLTVG